MPPALMALTISPRSDAAATSLLHIIAAQIEAPSPAPVDTSVLPSSVTSVGHANAVLFSPWVPAVLSLLAVGACVMTGRRLYRRRCERGNADIRSGELHRNRARVVSLASLGGALLAVVLAVSAGVNAYAGYLPSPRAAARFLLGREGAGSDTVAAAGDAEIRALMRTPGGRIAVAHKDTRWALQTISLSDPALRVGSRSVLIATPPGYRTGTGRYPVAYLFSGYPGRASDWFVSGRFTQTLDALAASGRAPYMIAVAPNVNGGFLTDSETLNAVRGPQVETWITRDVVTYLDTHYRTLPTRSGRILAGMSSGGFAAINLALHHQDEFGQTLALEPYGDPGNVTRRLLGGSVALLHANSPSYYAPTVALHRVLPMFLDVGSGGDVAPVRALGTVLSERAEPVLVRIERGQHHTWSEAAAGLPYALAYSAQQLSHPALLDAVFPPARFPPTGRDAYATTLSPDGEAQLRQRLSCDRAIRAAGDTGKPVPRSCAQVDRYCPRATLSTLPMRLTGTLLTRACPPPPPPLPGSRRSPM